MRIYVPHLAADSYLQLPAEEAKHATRVMRLKDGDACELFDGKGNIARATLVDCDRSSASVRVTTVEHEPKELPGHLTVAIGLPKGDRQRSVVERATELGVTVLQPLACEYSVAEATENAINRAKRTVIESCKQCERNSLMHVAEAQDSIDFFQSFNAKHNLSLLCHPGLPASSHGDLTTLSKWAETIAQQEMGIALAIGPEGGFSDKEVAIALQNGWIGFDLGERILRVETALTLAVSMATICLGPARSPE